MSFVIIPCNGDPLLVNEAKHYLTWFEEWVLYFRFVWGRVGTRGWIREKKINWN